MWHKIDQASFLTSQWTGGITTQLTIWPQQANYAERNFLYRISKASVELESSTFTALPDFNRYLTITEGVLDLTHDEAQWFTLKPYEVYAFEGGRYTASRGRVKDFNLMLSQSVKGEMSCLCLSEGEVVDRLFAEETTHLWLYIAEGEVEGGQTGEFFKVTGGYLRLIAKSQAVLILCQVDLQN